MKQTGDKGARKKTNNKWFETQDSISYWEDFSKQKIVWGEISDKTKFAIDLTGEFVAEATTFLMVGNSLLYLVSFLNSKLSEYIFSKIGTTTGVGTVRWKKFTIEQLLVPIISPEKQKYYEEIANQIIKYQTNKIKIQQLETQLNYMIYKEFDLSPEEIAFIDAQ